jgi:vancomycin aglycone glucosyltransferase
VYVGFGSMPAPKDIARVAIEAIRAQGRRALVYRGWADLAPIDDRDDCFGVGEVNQQALFGRVAAVVHHGGAGTTTTAARAGAPQVVYPRLWTSPTGPAGWPTWASAERCSSWPPELVTPVQAPCCAPWLQATSDQSRWM